MDAKLFLKNLRASYLNNIIIIILIIIFIIGHLDITSLRNKFEILSSLIADTFDIFMLSETELDDTFTSAQFSIKRFSVPHRFDCNEKGGKILLYARETLITLPLKKYSLPSNIKAIFFELNLRNKELIFCCYINPHKSLIRESLKELIKAMQFYFKPYDNLTLIRNLSNLFSSIPKHMTVLTMIEKLIKAIQFYFKTYDNLTFIRNLSKLFSSIPKHMTILC